MFFCFLVFYCAAHTGILEGLNSKQLRTNFPDLLQSSEMTVVLISFFANELLFLGFLSCPLRRATF